MLGLHRSRRSPRRLDGRLGKESERERTGAGVRGDGAPSRGRCRGGEFELELELIGSYETGFLENDDNARAWPVPNVIGVVRR